MRRRKRPRRQRCGARTRCNIYARRNRAARQRARQEGWEKKFWRASGSCKNWALPGRKRCRLHGAASTGPTTPEGMARTLAAMQAGRRRWLTKLKAEGKPIPCGRKKGGHNAPREEREHAAYLRKMDREFRKIDLRSRAERNARRAQ